MSSQVVIINGNPITADTNSTGNALVQRGSDGSINVGTVNATGAVLTGGQRLPLTTQSGTTYTMSSANAFVLADATAAAIAVTLPPPSGVVGQLFTIIKTDSGGHAVTLHPNSSETINGGSTVSLGSQYNTTTVYSDGTNWFKVV